MKIYNRGDKVWFAFAGQEQVVEPCPVCFGKLAVVLTLGNGDQVTTPCGYCGCGFEGPKGVVQEWKFNAEARLVEITDVQIRQNSTGEVREYSHKSAGHYYSLDWLRIFDTEAEATACAKELAEAAAMTQIRRRNSIKEKNQKSYAWHVGYHLQCAKTAKRDLEYHQARAVVCRALAKTAVPATP